MAPEPKPQHRAAVTIADDYVTLPPRASLMIPYKNFYVQSKDSLFPGGNRPCMSSVCPLYWNLATYFLCPPSVLCVSVLHVYSIFPKGNRQHASSICPVCFQKAIDCVRPLSALKLATDFLCPLCVLCISRFLCAAWKYPSTFLLSVFLRLMNGCK